MKLENKDIDAIDLAEEEKKTQWAKEIIDTLKGKIPIMTSIAKKAESAHFNFIGLARHATLAESLIYKCKRFRTPSEVYRAAMYIGMSLIYYMTKDEGTLEQKGRAGQIYKTIEVMESLNHNRQCIDAVVLSAKDLIECGESGVIDWEEMGEKISMLVDTLPRELKPIARDKVKRIMKGESIVDLTETKLQRGRKGLKTRISSRIS